MIIKKIENAYIRIPQFVKIKEKNKAECGQLSIVKINIK